jgi:dipeptidyl aminopeptidase/acylaminoacyl peptidase
VTLKAIDLNDTALWKQRFRVSQIFSAQLARANPARGLVVSNQRSNLFQLYAWMTSSAELCQLTYRPGGIMSGRISPDGCYIYFLDDHQGNELGHFVRLPFEGGEIEDVSPGLPDYTLRGVGFSLDGSMMAFNAVNADGFQLYCVSLGPLGELNPPCLIHQDKQEFWGAMLSNDGRVAAVISTARAGGTRRYSLLALDTANGSVIGEAWDGPQTSVEIAAFSPLTGDTRILAMTSLTGYTRPFIWNPYSGERNEIPVDGLNGDVIPMDWSPDGKQVLLCQIQRAHQQLYIYDLVSRVMTRLQHPSGTYYFTLGEPGERIGPWTCFGPDGKIWSLWEDSTHPPQMDILDAQTGIPARTMLKSGDAPAGRPYRSVTFRSSDGEEIQGWLGLPQGEPPFPTILNMHGGPHMVTSNTFDPYSQAWLDHGFAYLTINYRGSTTFGRVFKEKIWGDIGHWEVEDMVAAHIWLVTQGIARPDAIFLSGASGGGFLTLLGLGKRPELWAGGMAVVAIADYTAAYEDASDALKAAMKGWHNGTPQEKREEYLASSPITYAENVRAPVHIIQGRNDTRTPPRQMEMYEARMKSLGKQIEVVWFDAGHQAGDEEQVIEFQEREMLFAYRILMGIK